MSKGTLQRTRIGKPALKLQDFVPKLKIGAGAFGKVFLAYLNDDKKQPYAIKTIRKDKLIETNQIDGTRFEMETMLSVDHPFLCKMDYMFQD